MRARVLFLCSLISIPKRLKQHLTICLKPFLKKIDVILTHILEKNLACTLGLYNILCVIIHMMLGKHHMIGIEDNERRIRDE